MISCILFLDLKKAFDSVSHGILLKKLEYYGVRGIALDLFRSYLTNRKQFTKIGESLSVLDIIEWGVPQGSVLGPLLFLIFINDIPLASDLGTWLFADDTVLVESASSLAVLQAKMNERIDKVQTWLLANKLSVHYVDKSQYMLVNSNNYVRIEDHCFELKMANHIISRTKTFKYLGLIVDEKLSWTDHVNYVCLKLSQAAGVIFKVRNLLSHDALMLIYHALVSQKLRYGLICWATASKFLLDKVDIAHNKIVRYLSFSKACSRAWPIYIKLNVSTLDMLREFEWGKFMYKYQNNIPVYLMTISKNPVISMVQDMLNRTTLKNSVKNAKEKSLLKFLGPSKWSSIPLQIKQVPHLKTFMSLYKTHLIDTHD